MPRPGVLGGNACVAGLAEPPWRSAEDVASVGADDGGVPAASAQDRARVGRVPGRSPGTQKLGGGVRECGWRQMTRVACDVGPPRRMETCGAEEPYEGNLHGRFCGGIGRAIADPTRTRAKVSPKPWNWERSHEMGCCSPVGEHLRVQVLPDERLASRSGANPRASP